MQEEGALTDASRANHRNALSIANKPQDLADLILPTVELLGSSDCTAVEERIIYAHNAILIRTIEIVKRRTR